MSIAEQDLEAGRAARDAALRVVFPPRTLVWIVDEELEQVGPAWKVTLVYQGALHGRWMRRRHRFDIPSGTLHFLGEEPIGEAEAAAARRAGRKFLGDA